MTDQTQEKPKTIVALIGLPDIWNVKHYSIYTEGRWKYETPIYKAESVPVPVLSRYHGCLALIDSQDVRIPDEIKAIIAKPLDTIPLSFIGTIVRTVGLSLENALDLDFLG